jgi:hypothetical protein
MSWIVAGLFLGSCVVAGVLAMLRWFEDAGRDEGTVRGPRGGEGAVVHGCAGEDDSDGTPGDALPPGRNDSPDRNDPAFARRTRATRLRERHARGQERG